MGHTALLRGVLVLLVALLSIASASDAVVSVRARTELRRLRVGSLSPLARDARCAAAHAALAPESSSWRSTRLYTTDSPIGADAGAGRAAGGAGTGAEEGPAASLSWSSIDTLHVTVSFPRSHVGVRASSPVSAAEGQGAGVRLPPLEEAFQLRCPPAALPSFSAPTTSSPAGTAPGGSGGVVAEEDGLVTVATLRSRNDARYSPLRTYPRPSPSSPSSPAAAHGHAHGRVGRVLPPRLFLAGAAGDVLRAAAAGAFDVLGESNGYNSDNGDDDDEDGGDDDEEEEGDGGAGSTLRFAVPLRLTRPYAPAAHLQGQKQGQDQGQEQGQTQEEEEDEVVVVLHEEWVSHCRLTYLPPSSSSSASAPASTPASSRGSAALVTAAGAALGPFTLPLAAATTYATAPVHATGSAEAHVSVPAAASTPTRVPAPAPVPVRERAVLRLRRSPCARAHAFAHTLSVLTGTSSPTSTSASAAGAGAGAEEEGAGGIAAGAGAVIGAGAAVRGQAHSADTVALLEAEVKVGGIIGKMIDPVTGGITKPIMDLSDGLMMDSFTDHFTKKIYNSVNSEVAPDVATMLGATLKANLTNVLVEAVTYAVSASLINSVKNAWVPPIVARLVEHLPPQVCPPLEHVLKAKIPRTVEGRVPQIVARGLALTLTQGLTKSITHAVVPALTHALPHHQNSDAYCTACATGTVAACRLCHFSARTVYYQLYYSTFYADHYSGYYADYYTAAAQRVDEARHLQMDLPGGFLLPQTVEYVARNEASMQRAEELNRTGTAPRATFVEVMPPSAPAEEEEEAARAPLWGVPANAPVFHPPVDTTASPEAGPQGG